MISTFIYKSSAAMTYGYFPTQYLLNRGLHHLNATTENPTDPGMKWEDRKGRLASSQARTLTGSPSEGAAAWLTNSELQPREKEFGIGDVQLGLTTLEEVFMDVAMRTELETAFTEGRMTTFTMPNGLDVEIPVGARYIGISGTESPHYPQGFAVEVYWQQDPLTEKLCMAGHSAEIAVPPNFQRLPSVTSTTPPNTSGKGGTYS
ncbi:hypothetical protein PVK06_037373 [Gossypium arboreum]|uniref:ABC transporter A family member 2/9/11 C-terminal domain-containing protein n=1 Tax=Gossypium arboreum TaxID=29729 RepID=A0ABR0MX59_GOSAR|nr:hypothetical protein PVK06_037373 [Gossypium arboreum]